MCGIAGFNSINDIKPRGTIEVMLKAIKHRGPDDNGYFMNDNMAIGMTRLSIIDLNTGHQPIYNENKSLTIVYNGEIYNFLELKEWLEKKGHIFSTNTDTETILHLYEDFGEKCLNYLEGMFAFCIYDFNKRILFLARDRFGEKPLHYSLWKSNFVFGSEIKSILLFPGFDRELDYQGINSFFTLNYIPAPLTIFKHIQKLLPGYLGVYYIDNRQFHIRPYWDILYKENSTKKKCIEEYKEGIIHLLLNSVKKRLISDVPLGVFLSGGIDSSAIVALMKQLTPNIKTFSIGFSEPSFDETNYSRIVAKQFSTDHHEIVVEHKDVLSIIPKLADFLDEPFGDMSIIPTHILSYFARKHVKVVLGGDGADELFAGYPMHTAHYLMTYYNLIPRMIRQGLIEKMIYRIPVSNRDFSFDFKLKRFIRGGVSPSARHFIWQSPFTEMEKNVLFNGELRNELDLNKFNFNIDFYLGDKKNLSDFQQIEYLDFKMYLSDNILVKIDRASMANSLEVRSPFLDHHFAEFCVNIPSEFKWKFFCSKYILKKSLEGTLHKKIIYRKKKGFGIPLGKWFRNELYDILVDKLNSVKRSGLFNQNYINHLLTQHKRGISDNRKQLWCLFIFQLWYEKYGNN